MVPIKILRRALCRHDYVFVRNLYGDEILEWGWKRSVWQCRHCGKLLGRKMLNPEGA